MEQEIGKVYVVHNDWIRDPNPNGNMPYKIGITKGTVSDRYYGLGLKMPGEFVCDFAYEFDKDYDKIETTLHELLNESRINGEWFSINGTTLVAIKKICEMAGGILVTDSVEDAIDELQTDEDESQSVTKKTIKEKSFIYDGKEYIARLYKPGDVPAVYGEILRDGTRCRKMRSIARKYLKTNGIESSDTIITHDAVKKLINFLEGQLK
jgi:hypothetical protein